MCGFESWGVCWPTIWAKSWRFSFLRRWRSCLSAYDACRAFDASKATGERDLLFPKGARLVVTMHEPHKQARSGGVVSLTRRPPPPTRPPARHQSFRPTLSKTTPRTLACLRRRRSPVSPCAAEKCRGQLQHPGCMSCSSLSGRSGRAAGGAVVARRER